MSAGSGVVAGARRGSALRRPARRGAHLLAATGFALAQPLFDLLGKNAEFFAVRGSPPLDIVIFALAVTFVLPAALLAVELVVGAVSERAGVLLHLVFLGALAAVFAIQALERAGVDRTVLLVAGAVVAGIAFALAVARVALVRTFLTVLAAAPVVFLGIFLFSSPVSDLVLPADVEVDVAAVRSSTPVVVLLLDELPVISLLDDRGEIDSGRYPNFAELARSSTWFRYASTLSGSTTVAVPALLSGKRPQRGKLPVFENHPETLFTLLGADYRMNVTEAQTRLCPEELCGRQGDAAGKRLRTLFSDARVVYLHLVAPPALEDRLPAIDEAWANFEDAETDADDRGGLPKGDIRTFHVGREDEFADFLRSLRRAEGGRPSLNFLHVLLPHGPWLRYPDGREAAVASTRAPGRAGEVWWDEGLALQAYQRHLLQVGYTDSLLGALVERLRELDLWERALVVVAADHGVSFRKGDKRRAPTATNLAELAFTPFFLKLPGQSTGRAVEKHVTTVDVLPTIADALDVTIPWETDGASGLEEGEGARRVRVGAVAAPFEAAVDQRQASLARQIELFGTREWGPRLFGTGPYRDLVGRTLEEVGFAADLDGEAVIGPPASELLRALPRRSPLVPSPIAGTLTGAAGRGDTIAVAINGEIAAVCQAYQQRENPVRFSALASPDTFRRGDNAVRIFVVGGSPGEPALAELATRLVDDD